MAGKLLISTAYLPPVGYFSLILGSDEIFIEKEENYIKQTYRNRCNILSAHGIQKLTVPVYLGSLHKIPVKEIRIDYSKRWQSMHLRALTASYNSSPYFEFYFDDIKKVILRDHTFLLDLNIELLEAVLKILKIEKVICYTSEFEPDINNEYDFRYRISPKKYSDNIIKKYSHVFDSEEEMVPSLSIVDLIFNMGTESTDYL
jgi:hypothetical protein